MFESDKFKLFNVTCTTIAKKQSLAMNVLNLRLPLTMFIKKPLRLFLICVGLMAVFCVLGYVNQQLVETCSAFVLLVTLNSSPGPGRQNDGMPDLPHDFQKYMPLLCSVRPAEVFPGHDNASPLLCASVGPG